MNILLLYYTGTFNTRYVSQRLQEKLEAVGHTVTLYEIDVLKRERLDLTPYDCIGLGYPIYGFAAPWPFLHFVRKQRFGKGQRVFIYKNSGECYKENNASSKFVARHVRWCGARLENEYHFMMPYNIHFRFDEKIVKEMLVMNGKLMDILVYELDHHISSLKSYGWWPSLVASVVARPQYIGGDVNTFFYRIKKDRCINCDLCIKLCPMKNIYRNKQGEIAFHHHCHMCMRCSLNCPKDAFYIGILDSWGWRVNGAYNFKKIEKIALDGPVITDDTKGFFACYIRKYKEINRRYQELFGTVDETR